MGWKQIGKLVETLIFTFFIFELVSDVRSSSIVKKYDFPLKFWCTFLKYLRLRIKSIKREKIGKIIEYVITSLLIFLEYILTSFRRYAILNSKNLSHHVGVAIPNAA